MSNNIRYTSIIIENSNNIPKGQSDQIRYLANTHIWQTWGTGINSNLPLKTINAIGNHNTVMTMSNMYVGIGTTNPLTKLHVEGQSYFTSNVGIGTTLPQQKLDVIGSVKATAFIGNGSLLTNVVAESQWLNNYPSIYTLSNVGIGTTNPQTNLHIGGNTIVTNTLTTSNLVLSGIVSASPITGNNIIISGDIIPSACNIYNLGNSNYRFKDIYLSGNTIDLGGTKITRNDITGGIQILTNTGTVADTTVNNLYASNVGIGTALPQANLHVQGDALVTGNLTVSGSNSVNMLYASNIGIGTSLPRANLHVQGNALITGNLTVSGSNIVNNQIVNNIEYNSSNVIINNLSGLGPALKVSQSGAGSNYPIADFYDNDVSTTIPALRIADGGNVGIGTTNPQTKLDVVGDVKLSGYLNMGHPAFNVYYSGANISATTVILWNNIVLNNGSCYNSANGRFTAPVNGIYWFSFHTLAVSSGATGVQFIARNNGVNIAETRAESTYGNTTTVSWAQSLNATQYIDIIIQLNTMYGAGYNNFSGYLITAI